MSSSADIPGMLKGLKQNYRRLAEETNRLSFSSPVSHVYNPLLYARTPFEEYLSFCRPGVDFLLVGMNPGPWGMVQTGVPFGDADMVRNWLQIKSVPLPPPAEHPARPVHGPRCPRSEVSGRRLWGWAQRDFGTPEEFFSRFFVGNYCPLAFLEQSGRNRTPDRLKAEEKKRLFNVCDRSLARAVELIRPGVVLGIGRFAESRVKIACRGNGVKTGGMPHPSPASPRANQGWLELARQSIREYENPL